MFIDASDDAAKHNGTYDEGKDEFRGQLVHDGLDDTHGRSWSRAKGLYDAMPIWNKSTVHVSPTAHDFNHVNPRFWRLVLTQPGSDSQPRTIEATGLCVLASLTL